MKPVSRVAIASLLVILVTFAGCKSKQEKPSESKAMPQEKAGAAPAVPAPGKTVATAVLPQDKADAQVAAVRVLALMETGEFPVIYNEAATGFKKIGSESQFVAKFQQTRKRVGILKNPKEISFATVPGVGHVLVYRLENENYKTDMRLTFARSQNGKMELAGLNQHDELKK